MPADLHIGAARPLAGCAAFLMAALSCAAGVTSVRMLPGENWWGAASARGTQMPFTASSSVSLDLRASGFGNQTASFLVSDSGRYVWCDDQALVTVTNGELTLTTDSGAAAGAVKAGSTLRDAFLAASAKHFPPSGRIPDPMFFERPQYNTWIELTYNQNERDILAYARSMLDNGLPPGILMIDDTWQAGYGDWRFDPARFRDPKGMCDALHAMGFKVVLWVCPWVGMDSPAYREITFGRIPTQYELLKEKGGFCLGADRTPAASTWWNGKSALLDFSHPNACRWFRRELDRLRRDYGVDGFKFDGGDVSAFRGYGTFDKTASSGDLSMRYAAFAVEYPTSEYRSAWRMGGQPIVERLLDKGHCWEDLAKLVPDMLAAGLLGHSFVCPDMAGGGSWTAFLPGAPFDPELFVRSVQVHALCGMMQLSASPWRVLKDPAHRQMVRDAVALRQRFAPKFLELAKECAVTGEPMIRHMEYVFPGRGYAEVRDQFMMGDFLLVAPVVEKGALSRSVVLPPGRWRADDGSVAEGPATLQVAAPLGRLPHFVRLRD